MSLPLPSCDSPLLQVFNVRAPLRLVLRLQRGPRPLPKRSRRTRTKDGERCFETRGRLQLSIQTTPWRAGSPHALTDRALYINQGGAELNFCSPLCSSETDWRGNASEFPTGDDRYPRQCLLDDLCIVLLLSESVGLAQASRAAAGHWCFMTGRDASVMCYMMGRIAPSHFQGNFNAVGAASPGLAATAAAKDRSALKYPRPTDAAKPYSQARLCLQDCWHFCCTDRTAVLGTPSASPPESAQPRLDRDGTGFQNTRSRGNATHNHPQQVPINNDDHRPPPPPPTNSLSKYHASRTTHRTAACTTRETR
jgi:hypothetical protein